MKIKGLTVITLICVLVVVIINFTNYKLPELIDGKGQKFESLIENVCLAIITSYIFYFLNVYLVELKEKKHIMPFISLKVSSLLVNSKAMINYLRNDNSLNVKSYPTKEEFKTLLLNINPNSLVNKYSKKTWIEYFFSHQKSTLRQISIIYNSGKYIDEELRSYLLELEEQLLLKEDDAFNNLLFNELNLEKYYLVFYNYFDLLQKIDVYFEKKLKKHLKSHRPANGKVNSVKIISHGP